jgi:aryl-alcohol dehydrogenase-like predicted oxidoreductase
VLSQPGVTAALVGARNAQQARENAAALEVCLDEREEHAIRRVFEALD